MSREHQRRALLTALRAFLPSIVCREVIAAREGLKVARAGLRRRAAERLRRLGDEHGFAAVIDDAVVHPRRDRGKGGWCNGLREHGDAGYHNTYIALTEQEARCGLEAERRGDEPGFGEFLAIPRCCREFYSRNQPRAERAQNDFFPISAERVAARPHAALNLGAQYFDASLLSHFPCSLRCADSLRLARATAELVAAYDRAWLDEMLALMSRPTLYTEYEGVFLLRSVDVRAVDDIAYDSAATMGTARGRVAAALARGNHVRSLGGERVEVLRDGVTVASLRARNLRLFAPLPVTADEFVL